MIKLIFQAFPYSANRIFDGIADAAAFGSMVSLLLVLFPDRAAMIVGLTESMFALGYTLGKFEYLH